MVKHRERCGYLGRLHASYSTTLARSKNKGEMAEHPPKYLGQYGRHFYREVFGPNKNDDFWWIHWDKGRRPGSERQRRSIEYGWPRE